MPLYNIHPEVDWSYLSKNPNAIHLLEQNLDKVNWYDLSGNPNSIHLLEQHLDKVWWNALSANPNAISLLEQHQDKIIGPGYQEIQTLFICWNKM